MPNMETNTPNKTKKKTRRNAKKISVAEAEAKEKAAVEEAIKKAREQWEQEQLEEGFEDPEDHGDTGLSTLGFSSRNSEDLDEFTEEEAAWNIFDWIEEKYYSKGIPVVYQVKKNGEVQGEFEHPCSWTYLQEKCGGGQFQVVAKTAMEKQYIKSQRQMVRAPLNPKKDDKQPVSQPQNIGLDMNDMFKNMVGMFAQMQEMVQKERSREDRDEKKSSENFNTTFLTLMQNQQKATSEMFLKIAEMSTQTANKQSENFSKVIEKMDDKFSRMFEKLADSSTKKDSLGPMELIKLLNDSRKEGQDMMKTLIDLSEAKAESMAESMADRDPESKESLLATLVKGMAPILSKANRNLDVAYGAQQRGTLPRPQQVISGPGQIPQGIPQAPTGQRTPSHIPTPPTAPVNAGPQQSSRVNQKISLVRALGMPTFTDRVKSGGSVGAVKEPVIPQRLRADILESEKEVFEPNQTNKGENFDRSESEVYKEASIAQQTIGELTVPVIAQHIYDDKILPKDVAQLCLAELADQGFTAEVVVREFKIDDIIIVAKTFGIGDEKKQWFEDFYNEIQNATGNGTIGTKESVQNQI